MFNKIRNILGWLLNRVGFIYFLLFLFIISCVDLKLLESRNKVRRLNGDRPNFVDMLNAGREDGSSKKINWEPFKSYFELVLRYIPDHMAAKELLGYVSYQMGRENKSIDLFKSTEEYNSVLFWPNYNLGVINFKKGRYQEACDYLIKAISTNPEVIKKFMLDEIIYKQIFATALFDFNLQERINNAIASSYVLIIASLARLQQYDKVLFFSATAMKNKDFPYQAAFYFYSALACLELKQIDKALLLLSKNIELDNQNPVAYYYLAQIYKSIGKQEASLSMFKRYEEVRNKNKDWVIYDQRIQVRFY